MATKPEARFPGKLEGLGHERTPILIKPPLPVIVYQNIIVLVDGGEATLADYSAAETIAREQSKAYPSGLGCVVIIPSEARPPSEEVRRAIKASLGNLATSLRCLCWLVEGKGFRAATVRAALAGLGLFVRVSYPTCVQSDLAGGLRWMFPYLVSKVRQGDVLSAVASIERDRRSFGSGPTSASREAPFKTQ